MTLSRNSNQKADVREEDCWEMVRCSGDKCPVTDEIERVMRASGTYWARVAIVCLPRSVAYLPHAHHTIASTLVGGTSRLHDSTTGWGRAPVITCDSLGSHLLNLSLLTTVIIAKTEEHRNKCTGSRRKFFSVTERTDGRTPDRCITRPAYKIKKKRSGAAIVR